MYPFGPAPLPGLVHYYTLYLREPSARRVIAASVEEVGSAVTVPQLRVLVMATDHSPLTLSNVAEGLAVHNWTPEPTPQLVWGGMTPTPAAVAGLVADKAARRARRVEEAADVAVIAARDGVAAAVAVARIVEDTGTGPTWTELRAAMGWSRRASREIIPKLLQAGWLTSTTEHRSLRPGPRHTPTPRAED